MKNGLQWSKTEGRDSCWKSYVILEGSGWRHDLGKGKLGIIKGRYGKIIEDIIKRQLVIYLDVSVGRGGEGQKGVMKLRRQGVRLQQLRE